MDRDVDIEWQTIHHNHSGMDLRMWRLLDLSHLPRLPHLYPPIKVPEHKRLQVSVDDTGRSTVGLTCPPRCPTCHPSASIYPWTQLRGCGVVIPVISTQLISSQVSGSVRRKVFVAGMAFVGDTRVAIGDNPHGTFSGFHKCRVLPVFWLI